MPVMLTEEALSLRHLPEVSDCSISFQIPTSFMPKGDDLMADDNTFFEGTNNSILATPAPFGRATIRPPSPTFTSGPSGLGPSTARQKRRTVPPSNTPNPSDAHPELQTLPVHVTSMANREQRRSEKGPLEGDAKLAHQDREESQVQHSCPSANASTSTISHTLSPPPVPAGQSSPESRSEVRYSESGLPLIESSSCSGSRTTEETNEDPKRVDTKEPKVQTTSRHSTLTDRPRPSVSKKHLRRPTVVGGIMKSRKKHKAAAARTGTGPALTSVRPESVINSSIVDRSQAPDLSLSTFVLTGGTAERLLTYSQGIMAGQNEATSSAARNMMSGYPVDRCNARPDGQENQDTDMNLDDLPGFIHASISGDRDDEREKHLTVSQLSPRKRGAVQAAVVEQQHGDSLSFPPAVPALAPVSSSQASRKKQPAPVLLVNRYDLRKRKRDSHHSSATIPVPHPTDASTGDQSLTLASSSSATPPTMGLCGNEITADGLNVDAKIRGGREEANEGNVLDNDHAKMAFSSEMISTSECGSHIVETGSGSASTAKKDMKGPAGNGARTRTRKASNLSLSVNGGRTLRRRSVSNSASARGEVLRASERGRRSTQVRARKEARKRDKLGKLDEAEEKSGNDGGNEGSSSGSKLKRSGMTYLGGSTRSVQLEFSTDVQMQAREGEERRMTRSASSLSRSGGGEWASKRKVTLAIQSAEQIHRKENIHPVIPQPFQWATEQRIQERRKFDDTVKEKVREREELEERRRQEKEEEEEREVRELRKRAIPKANPVPEWYKDVPKKKGERK